MDSELARLRWNRALFRGADGAPLLSPLFVLEQGPGVHLVDLRPPDEALGVTGHIPGCVFLPAEQVAELPKDLPLVLLSRTGEDAARVARELEKAGARHVAAMAGGLSSWRKLGLGISRNANDLLTGPPAPAPAPEPAHALTLEEVSDHIGDPRTVRRVKLSSLSSHLRCSCVDGRDERGVIGTLGGDAGEFLLAIAALEQVTGATLTSGQVREAVTAHVDTFGEFYMHTDQTAFEALAEAARADDRLRGAVAGLSSTEEWVAFLSAPPEPLRDALLDLMVDPAHVGCGHMRLMLQHSDEYGIRPALVRDFIRAYYGFWWQGVPEFSPTLLPGGHKEGAVVNVLLDEKPWPLSYVPLISPACHGTQMFVNHPQVVAELRRHAIEFHLRGLGPVPVPPDREDALRAAFAELAQRQATQTLTHLAQGLPVYDAVFARDGSFLVRVSGA
ncbi:MAG: rhodanese-like domain-containing protein [Planctomycetota bacterium]|jgi:rhodanese-related sulfurtransferase